MYFVVALPILTGSLTLVGTAIKALSLLVGFRFTYTVVIIVWLLLIVAVVMFWRFRKGR